MLLVINITYSELNIIHYESNILCYRSSVIHIISIGIILYCDFNFLDMNE